MRNHHTEGLDEYSQAAGYDIWDDEYDDDPATEARRSGARHGVRGQVWD
ncbi:hypothetical protein [Mycolicibacterium fortuitum]|nr:hypothetical protein [Mycolicibacterium fortuitum]